MSVLVTVGSTSFDSLIETLCSEEFYNVLEFNGFRRVIFQIGRGKVIPSESSKLKIEWFRYKDSLSDDIQNASLVIGHAGAGTILESLFKRKPLIVVLNEHLMENHQGELAEKLESEGYLKSTTCSHLIDAIKSYFSHGFVNTFFVSQNDVFNEILEGILSLK